MLNRNLEAVPKLGPLLGVVRVDDKGSLPNSQVNQLPCALPQLLLILIKWTSYTMVRGVRMFLCHRVELEATQLRCLGDAGARFGVPSHDRWLDNVNARKYFYIALNFSKTNNRTVPMPSA